MRRAGQDFRVTSGGGKLKNWKSEKLTSRPATRLARIPDFQDFRFSPTTDAPEILQSGPGGVGVGNVLNGRFTLKTGPLGLGNIRFR
jgi:hypothetical protein